MSNGSCAAWVAMAMALLLSAGCECDGSSGGDGGVPDDGSTGMDAEVSDGSTGLDGSTGDDGSLGMDGTVPADGGPVGCVRADCGEQSYQCGNCIDDDGDGLVDSRDPDCVGACDNNEGGYDLGIPGGEVGLCTRDCYYDTNQGRGECLWDIQCDSTLDMHQSCRPAGPPQCPMPQSDTCVDTCAPLVPNGCDCFGCCELPSGSGSFVWLGSNVGGVPSCTFDDISDPTRCFPCVPYGGVAGDDPCYNPCGRCELCLGRDPATIPADCFPDADAGPLPDGGAPPPPTCDDGRQACDLPGFPPCPDGYYCLTGCCTLFG
ncbi:MAG: hypothetical protein RLO52_07270 [Sandaracinaceae bacterium]